MSQPSLSPHVEAPPTDHVIVLQDVTWADYQRLLEIRGERPVPRLTFLEGALELMTPSQPHGSLKSMIGCLVEAWCLENRVDITPYGSWTLESKEAGRGIEPDECYVLGDAAEPQRCDLAIEVVWTTTGLNKLDVYRKLGVPEVWVWRSGTIHVFVLRDAEYVERQQSDVLPGIELAVLQRFFHVRPMTRAVNAYRAALRGDA